VYAAKASDVSDVMVNGQWVMREHQLLTLNETALASQAQVYARQIDAFLLEREQSILSKLLAIGGAVEAESFEVQAKVRIADPDIAQTAIKKPEIEILHYRHYHEYDTYFSFADPKQGYLRHREDEFIDPNGEIANIRYRLTLLGQARERDFPGGALLSRSRFLAPANHSLRFYREYFKPSRETFVKKDRLRWRVLYHGMEFFINLDRVEQPDLGYFLEIKSHTWSRSDAERKAQVTNELITFLGASPTETVSQDYVEFVEKSGDAA